MIALCESSPCDRLTKLFWDRMLVRKNDIYTKSMMGYLSSSTFSEIHDPSYTHAEAATVGSSCNSTEDR